MTARRNSTHLGRSIVISGASNKCMVWIDDRMPLGEHRFPSIQRARAAAVDYINRHAKPDAGHRAMVAEFKALTAA